MTDTDSLLAGVRTACKGDAISFAERDARVRAGLAGFYPILAQRGIAPLERLFDYSIHVRDETLRAAGHLVEDPGMLNTQGLQAAAETVLAWVQIELRGREREDPLATEVASELVFARMWAHRAHLERHGRPSFVKGFELAVSGGAPRAICWGTNHTLALDDDLSVRTGREISTVATYAPGCLRVFPDMPETQGRAWRQWCPRCEPNIGRHSRYREHMVTRRIKAYAAGLPRPQ